MIAAGTIAAILGAVVSGLFAVSLIDSTTGTITSSIRNKNISKKINDISEQVVRDQNLAQQLVNAYENKDIKLANDIIGRSPMGSAFNKIKREAKANSKLKEDAQRELTEITAAGNKAASKAQNMPSGTNSLIGDLIMGGTKVKGPEYESKQDSLQQRLDSVK